MGMAEGVRASEHDVGVDWDALIKGSEHEKEPATGIDVAVIVVNSDNN
jgi:hypothetical protein